MNTILEVKDGMIEKRYDKMVMVEKDCAARKSTENFFGARPWLHALVRIPGGLSARLFLGDIASLDDHDRDYLLSAILFHGVIMYNCDSTMRLHGND